MTDGLSCARTRSAGRSPRSRRSRTPSSTSGTGSRTSSSSRATRAAPASGSGSHRLYSFRDILVLKVVKRLLDTGVSLQQIRTAVEHLRERGVDDLAQITLMSDGASVYECTSPDEVVDLVQGGQGVFGIAVGRVWRQVEGTLAELPTESLDDEDGAAVSPQDELAQRRRARSAG